MHRRTLLKSLAALPLVVGSGSALAAVSGKYDNRFKLSLNVYSFNRLLRDGAIDLFDVLELDRKSVV